MNSSELLRKMGYHYNPRPEPDALGRRTATPVEILKAMSGENLPHENIVFQRGKSKKPHGR